MENFLHSSRSIIIGIIIQDSSSLLRQPLVFLDCVLIIFLFIYLILCYVLGMDRQIEWMERWLCCSVGTESQISRCRVQALWGWSIAQVWLNFQLKWSKRCCNWLLLSSRAMGSCWGRFASTVFLSSYYPLVMNEFIPFLHAWLSIFHDPLSASSSFF